MSRRSAENPFNTIVTTGKQLVPGDITPGIFNNYAEAKPGSLGTIDPRVLAMFGMALVCQRPQLVAENGEAASVLAEWAIPMLGMIPGRVMSIDVSRSQSDGGATERTCVYVHSLNKDSADHIGLRVAVNTGRDSEEARDASIVLLGGVERGLMGDYRGDAHHVRGVLMVDSTAMAGLNASGSESMFAPGAAVPLVAECARLITGIATNPAIAR